ncbi:MAG: hypothetical protein ACLR1V_16100 [Coprococcus sp.]
MRLRETQLQIYKAILAFVLTAGSVGALLICRKTDETYSSAVGCIP